MNFKDYLLELETLRNESFEAGDDYGAYLLSKAIGKFIEYNKELTCTL